MDVWFEKKNNLIEGLLNATHRMLEASRAEDWAVLEDRLNDRTNLINQIQKCDENILEAPSRFDSFWHAQLGLVRALDKEIFKLVDRNRVKTGRRLVQLQDLKLELVKEFDIDPRGQRLKAEA